MEHSHQSQVASAGTDESVTPTSEIEDPKSDSGSLIRIIQPERSQGMRFAKRLVQRAFEFWVLFRVWRYYLFRIAFGRNAFIYAVESVGSITGFFGVYLRQAFYRKLLNCCGDDLYIGWQSTISHRETEIGHRVYIGKRCSVGLCRVEDEVMIADGVNVLSGSRVHTQDTDKKNSMHDSPQEYRRIRIGKGSWIGASAVIMADVGEHSIVGAGAVVTKPVSDKTMVGGVPAQVLRQL